MLLHGYWRSSAAYRVRLALALKGIDTEHASHDLRRGEQRADAYRALNPQGFVPALTIDDGTTLIQSLAILEWLEETHPAPPLLPADPIGRAVVRAMAGIVACDVHPLNNLRVLNALRTDLAAGEAQVQGWIARWIGEGFAALEPLIARHGGAFAFGDTPTIADCCLVPQLYNAERFAVPTDAWPAIRRAASSLRALPEAAAAHPDRQPDAAPG